MVAQLRLFSYSSYVERLVDGLYFVTVCIAFDGTLLSRQQTKIGDLQDGVKQA